MDDDSPICMEPGCTREADGWSYCFQHTRSGPLVGVGFHGDQVGDEVASIAEVDLVTYRSRYAGSPHASRVREIASDALDRWDPDGAVDLSARVKILESLLQWMVRTPEFQPMVVVPDLAPPTAFQPIHEPLAAIRIDDTTFFGAGALVRQLVPLLVVPAIPVVAGQASLTVAAVSAATALVAQWLGLTKCRVSLVKEDEIRVFNVVHYASYDLQRRPDGKRVATLVGADATDLYEQLRPWPSQRVKEILDDLQQREIVKQHAGRWRIRT